MAGYVRSKYDYDKRKYDRTVLVLPAGARDELKRLAEADGISLNRYFLEAIEQKSGLKLTLDNALPWMKK